MHRASQREGNRNDQVCIHQYREVMYVIETYPAPPPVTSATFPVKLRVSPGSLLPIFIDFSSRPIMSATPDGYSGLEKSLTLPHFFRMAPGVNVLSHFNRAPVARSHLIFATWPPPTSKIDPVSCLFEGW